MTAVALVRCIQRSDVETRIAPPPAAPSISPGCALRSGAAPWARRPAKISAAAASIPRLVTQRREIQIIRPALATDAPRRLLMRPKQFLRQPPALRHLLRLPGQPARRGAVFDHSQANRRHSGDKAQLGRLGSRSTRDSHAAGLATQPNRNPGAIVFDKLLFSRQRSGNAGASGGAPQRRFSRDAGQPC